MEKQQKPQQEIVPRMIWVEQRARDLADAIQRSAWQKQLDTRWIDELQEHVRWLEANGKEYSTIECGHDATIDVEESFRKHFESNPANEGISLLSRRSKKIWQQRLMT